MSWSEFTDRFLGKRDSSVVDEQFSTTGRPSHLRYFAYDGDGRLKTSLRFPRNESPQEIADSLNIQADYFIKNPPDGISSEDLISIVKNLREQAKNVPGL